MKMNAGWSKKSGRARYGSEGALITFEVDVADELFADPAKHADLIKNARSLTLLAKRAVEEEIAIADSKAAALAEREEAEAEARNAERIAAEEHHRIETGERPDPKPAPRRQTEYDDRDSQVENDHRAETRRDADRVESRNQPRARWGGNDDRSRDDRRSNDRGGQRGGGNGRGGNGNPKIDWTKTNQLPKTGKQLYGYANDLGQYQWFADYAGANNLPSRFSEWTNDEVADAIAEFTGEPAPARSSNGNGNGNGYRNGRRDGY
jgi:hypothetical protein